MGVSNVKTSNNIIQLALAKRSGRTGQAFKPLYLTDQGSIFNAPGVKQPGLPTTPENLRALNTNRSLRELNRAPANNGSDGGDENPFDANDASSGKASISKGKAMIASTRGYTSQVKSDAGTAAGLSREGVTLNKDIVTGRKTFAAAVKAGQTELKEQDKALRQQIKEAEELDLEITKAQDELAKTNDNTKAGELQQFIGAKVGKLQQNGKMIYSLQRNQTRTLARLNRNNRNYLRLQNNYNKNIQQNETKTNKLIDTATKIEQYSALASNGGQLLGIAGTALMALGSSMSGTIFGSAVGAALIAIGEGMKVIGNCLELAGNYGQAAAAITKTAAYAAEGNLMGAMMSCASAVQAGSAAVNSTKNIGNDIKDTITQANDAKANLAAKTAAKAEIKNEIDKQAVATKLGKEVKDVTNDDIKNNIGQISKKEMKEAKNTALGGMSEKQAKKYVTANLRAQISEKKLTKIKDMREFSANNATDSLKKAKEAYTTAQNKVAKDLNLGETLASATTDSKGKKYLYDAKDGDKTKKMAIKKTKVEKQIKKEFKNTISGLNAPKTSTNMGDKLQKLGTGVTNMAAMFMQNKAMESASAQPKKQVPQWYMDARTQRIIEKNQRYRRAYV